MDIPEYASVFVLSVYPLHLEEVQKIPVSGSAAHVLSWNPKIDQQGPPCKEVGRRHGHKDGHNKFQVQAPNHLVLLYIDIHTQVAGRPFLREWHTRPNHHHGKVVVQEAANETAAGEDDGSCGDVRSMEEQEVGEYVLEMEQLRLAMVAPRPCLEVGLVEREEEEEEEGRKLEMYMDADG